MKEHKRRNYFIKKDFQGRYVFVFFSFIVLGSIIFSLVFSLFTAKTLTITYENYNLQLGVTPLILLKQIITTGWVYIFFGGLAVGIISIYLTHQVAGPVYRLEKSFDEMLSGTIVSAIQLRKKDEGRELTEKINCFNKMLSEHFHNLRDINQKIEAELADLVSKTEGSQEHNDFYRSVHEIARLNSELKEGLFRFKIQE